METTLLIIKPDGVQRGLIGRIVSRFEDKGLQIVGMKMMLITPELAATHYAEHKSKKFYPGLVRFMTKSPVVVIAARGVGAVAVARSLMGGTFGPQAAAGTIRGDLGISNAYNLIHGSDSPDSAARELKLFFAPGEVQDYDHVQLPWLYDAEEELKV